MFYPTTGLQVASHDAWLEDMSKEPSPKIGRVARAEGEGRRMRSVALRLAGVAKRLRTGHWPEVATASDTPAQAAGAKI